MQDYSLPEKYNPGNHTRLGLLDTDPRLQDILRNPGYTRALLRAPPLWPAFDTKHLTDCAIAMVETHGI